MSDQDQAPEAEEQEDTETTLREDLAALMKDATEEDDADDAADDVGEADEAEEGAEEEETDEDSGEAGEQDETSDDEQSDEADAKEPLEAPEHWPTEAKAEFAKLPEDAQGQVLSHVKRLEGESTERGRELAEKAKIADTFSPLMDDLQPIRQHLALQGVDETTFLRSLIGWHNVLSQNPLQGLYALAQRYGVDPVALSQPEDADLKDPQVAALEGKVVQLEQMQTASQQAQARAALEEGQRMLTDFAEAKDAEGNPKHPHFEVVQGTVLALAQAKGLVGPALQSSMESLYEEAVWADPSLRQSLIEQQKADAKKQFEEEQEKRRKEETQKAKKAKTTVKSSPSGGDKEIPADTLREELRRQMRKAS